MKWRLSGENKCQINHIFTLEYGSDFKLELAMARASAAVSMTVSDLGISDFIFVSRELLMVSRPTLGRKQAS